MDQTSVTPASRHRFQEIACHCGCICRYLRKGRFSRIFLLHIPGICRAVIL